MFEVFVDGQNVFSAIFKVNCPKSTEYEAEYCGNLNDDNFDDGLFSFDLLIPHTSSNTEIIFSSNF